MATLKDIAQSCNVSISTVSRVLKNDRSIKVNANTRNNILSTASKLGYQIKKQNTTGTNIAIINWYSHDQELIDPYYYYIRKSIEATCKQNNFTYTNFFKEDPTPNLQLFDAVIALGKFNKDYANNIKQNVSNLVFIGYNPDHSKYDSVEINYELLMENIFDYGQTLNVSSIGLMNGVEDIGDKNFIDSRVNAFDKVARNYSFTTQNKSINGLFTMESGYDMLLKLHSEQRVPDFIICGNDMIALGANKAAYKLGYTVGMDIKIIGIGDIPNAKFMVPSLTTVTVPLEQIGIEAINLLKRRINEVRPKPISIMIPTTLKIRKST